MDENKIKEIKTIVDEFMDNDCSDCCNAPFCNFGDVFDCVADEKEIPIEDILEVYEPPLIK